MSKRSSVDGNCHDGSGWRMFAFGVVALLIASMLLGKAGTVVAQDATPSAAPAAECVSPGLPPGSPTPQEEMASPEAMEMASPEAMDMGTPEPAVAPEHPVGTPADEATAAAFEAAVSNYIACYNAAIASGDWTNSVALESENYWLSQTGSANPYDRVAAQAEDGAFLGTVEVKDVSNVVTYEDGRVGGDIQVVFGGSFGTGFHEIVVQDGDIWKWDEEWQISAESFADMTTVKGVDITETVDDAGKKTYEFAWQGGQEIPATEAIVFHVNSPATNTEWHEAFVAQLPEGADPLGLLDGSVGFDQAKFVGVIFDLAPGQSRDMVFYNLAPGTYTVYCFFEDANGEPHAMNGLVSQFTVTEPAA